MMRGVLGTLVLAAGLASWQAPGAPGGFADRTGPYLGETPPGLTPELFATGLVSTGGFERDVAITPDSQEIYFGLAEPIVPVRDGGLHPPGRRALDGA